MPQVALVADPRTRCKGVGQQRFIQPPSRGRNIEKGLSLHAQRAKVDLAGIGWRIAGMQPDLVANEGNGAIRHHRTAQHGPAIRRQARGNVQRQHRLVRAIDGLDGLADVALGFTSKPGTQQGIDDHLPHQRRGGLPLVESHPGCRCQPCRLGHVTRERCQGFGRKPLNLEPCLHGQGRQHMAIAPVIAAST